MLLRGSVVGRPSAGHIPVAVEQVDDLRQFPVAPQHGGGRRVQSVRWHDWFRHLFGGASTACASSCSIVIVYPCAARPRAARRVPAARLPYRLSASSLKRMEHEAPDVASALHRMTASLLAERAADLIVVVNSLQRTA